MSRPTFDKTTKERIDNTGLLHDSGLRVIHIRPNRALGGKGMTIAFEPTDKPVVKISTSLCKFGDTFCKKLGTKQAVENFQSGSFIRVPVDRRFGVVSSIIAMFRF